MTTLMHPAVPDVKLQNLFNKVLKSKGFPVNVESILNKYNKQNQEYTTYLLNSIKLAKRVCSSKIPDNYRSFSKTAFDKLKRVKELDAIIIQKLQPVTLIMGKIVNIRRYSDFKEQFVVEIHEGNVIFILC